MSNVNTQEQHGKTVLKCFVIDDEQAAIKKLESFIKLTPGLEFSGSETDPLKAEALLSVDSNLPDILFLDIDMKGPYGLKLAGMVMNKTHVIFTTGHREFAVQAYRLNAVDYLMKPIAFAVFLEAIGKVKTWIDTDIKASGPVTNMLFLRDALSAQTFRMHQNEILYIKSLANYCRVFLIDDSKVMPHKGLKQILSQLRPDTFVRIHKSYVININHVRRYEESGIVQLINDVRLEVGRTFRKKLIEKIKEAHGK